MIKRKLGCHPRFAVLNCRLPNVPTFVWHVAGRKIFDKRYSAAVRKMWKIGNYGI